MQKLRQTIKKSMGMSLGLAAGITLGGVIAPRLTRPEHYGPTYPALPVHALMYFAGGFVICLACSVVIAYLREWREKP